MTEPGVSADSSASSLLIGGLTCRDSVRRCHREAETDPLRPPGDGATTSGLVDLREHIRRRTVEASRRSGNPENCASCSLRANSIGVSRGASSRLRHEAGWCGKPPS